MREGYIVVLFFMEKLTYRLITPVGVYLKSKHNTPTEGNNMKKFFKVTGSVIGGIFAMGIIGAACTDEDVSKTKEPAKQEVKQEVKVDQKQKVQEFHNELTRIETSFKPIMSEVETALRNNDAFTAYDASVKAHAAAKSISYEYSKMKVPGGLDEEVETLLKKAKQDMQTSYYVKKQAIESLQKFLDDRKPSDQQDFKNKSNSAQAYTLGATMKIFQAQQKAGAVEK